jgi:short-subunit dehydrogenase
MDLTTARSLAREGARVTLRFFETNVLSGIRLARHYVGSMRSRNWGRIVFVSSESALQIPAEMIHYGIPKPPSSPSCDGRGIQHSGL